MNMLITHILKRALWLACVCCISLISFANATPDQTTKPTLITTATTVTTIASIPATTTNQAMRDPFQAVQQTTEQVLLLVKNAKDSTTKNPEHFNKQVTEIMDKVIDFDQFARGVMGSYASEQRLKTLATEAEKNAFRERIQRFSITFKKGLVDTYANGLLNFNGEKIQTLPPRKGDDPSTGATTVIQNIFNDSGKPYVIQYSMRRNKMGEWKLHNLIIEGINLGLTYRSQFAESADRNKGDLDKVIASWSVEPKIATDIKTNNVNNKTIKTNSATSSPNNSINPNNQGAKK
jgi:phospholipid transport system substrate-binding protein